MIAVQKSCIHTSAVALFVEWWIVVFVDNVSFHRGICTLGASFIGTVRQHSGALIITLTCIAAVKSIIMAATCSYSILDSAIDAAAARLGYEEVKPEQREAVRGLVNGRDVFVALPTGFGKSLCHAAIGF